MSFNVFDFELNFIANEIASTDGERKFAIGFKVELIMESFKISPVSQLICLFEQI